MKTVLLTGATGFVGRQILKALKRANVKIIPIVRSGKEPVLDGTPKVERVISSPDIFSEDVEWWAKQCEGVDIAIHAAWYAEPGQYLQSPLNIECLIGSLNLAKGAVNAGVKRFVGIGTCFEYDLSVGLLSIDAPLKPATTYASTKAALYMGLAQWLPAQSVEFVWCRLFYLYGEGEDKRRLVGYLRDKFEKGEPAELTSGDQIRDYMDVSDAGMSITNVALGNCLGPVNICSGVPITIKNLAEQIADQYNCRHLIKLGARDIDPLDPQCVLGVRS